MFYSLYTYAKALKKTNKYYYNIRPIYIFVPLYALQFYLFIYLFSDKDNEHSLSEDTPSLDASLLPLSPETAVVQEMPQISSHQDKPLVEEFNDVVKDDQVTCENNKYVIRNT